MSNNYKVTARNGNSYAVDEMGAAGGRETIISFGVMGVALVRSASHSPMRYCWVVAGTKKVELFKTPPNRIASKQL